MKLNKFALIPGIFIMASGLAEGSTLESLREEHCASCARMYSQSAVADAWNERLGENPIHQPHERQVDIEHLRLEINFPPLETRTASVVETMIFSSTIRPIKSLTLDAADMDISAVELLGDDALVILRDHATGEFASSRALPWHHDGRRLQVLFPEELPLGSRSAIRIVYTVDSPTAGLNWIEPLPGDRDPRWEVWSHGQPEHVKHWMITHDYPNERHSTELIVRAPSELTVNGTGALIKKNENGDGTSTWHWRMELPHVSYLVNLVIGTFEVERAEWKGIPLEFYVPPQNTADINRTFKRTAEMMELYSRLFAEDYPFPRYAQLVARDFPMGGMENITASTLTTRVLQGAASDQFARSCSGNMEYLIAHELAHSWFGNLITCRNWSHAWLNEGWASYSEELWTQADCGQDDYLDGIWRRRDRITWSDTVESGSPLVNLRHDAPIDMFMFNGSAIYNKGAFVLHMLREELGEESFWQGTQQYIDLYKFGVVETSDFRRALETSSGRDLEGWFRQWCHTPGTPKIDVALEWLAERSVARIIVEQTQPISEAIPAFSGTIPVWFEMGEKRVYTDRVQVNRRRHEFDIPLAAAPEAFAWDPNLGFLAAVSLKAPVEILRQSAKRAPTVTARMEAVRALAKVTGVMNTTVLSEIAENPVEFHGVRREAIRALGRRSGTEGRAALVLMAGRLEKTPAPESDFRLRTALADALAETTSNDAVTSALLVLAQDPSEPVAAAATKGLGLARGNDASIQDQLLKSAERRGENDRILQAALEALANRGVPNALDMLVEATKPTTEFRVRPVIVRRIGTLQERAELPPNGNASTDRLIELLADPRHPVRIAAIDALSSIGWRGALPALRRIADSPDDALSGKAKDAVTAIRAPKGTREDVRALEKEVNELKTKLDELNKDVERIRPTPTPVPVETKKKKKRFLFF